MRHPERFNSMLNWSHIAAGFFKALFALVGFLTFGSQTEKEISLNLPTDFFRGSINLILVAKALLSYPLPFFAAIEQLENVGNFL